MSKLLQRLLDPARSGVYRVRDVAAVLEAARGGGLDVVTVDAAGDVFEAMARSLGFPEWFGRNWDALEDCLGDLSWRADAARVLLLQGYPRDERLGILVDVLGSSAEFWAGRGKAFFALFVDPGGNLDLPALYRER